MTVDQIRRLALALQETIEQEHFGNPSFRIRGRIFATVPDGGHVNVMIDPIDLDGVVREDPESCAQLLWGKEVRGVRVALRNVAPGTVPKLLEMAWRRKAPRSYRPL